MENQAKSLTEKPLETLPFSQEFLLMAKANKFETLDDLLKTPMHQFPDLTQCGYRLTRELINFLNDHGMGHLIRD